MPIAQVKIRTAAPVEGARQDAFSCGDLRQGFARVRCRDCGHEYLLAYSCKGRYFCTSVADPRAHQAHEVLGALGFNVNAAVRIGAADAAGPENLARYLIRAPFSMNKIRYDPVAGTVIYKTKMVQGPNRNYEIFEPLDFLAAVICHIPNRGEHLVRYYGYYSSVQRGRRRRQGREKLPLGPAPLSDDTPTARSMRASWARFIKKVFAADPLVCLDCGGPMRIIAFIED